MYVFLPGCVRKKWSYVCYFLLVRGSEPAHGHYTSDIITLTTTTAGMEVAAYVQPLVRQMMAFAYLVCAPIVDRILLVDRVDIVRMDAGKYQLHAPCRSNEHKPTNVPAAIKQAHSRPTERVPPNPNTMMYGTASDTASPTLKSLPPIILCHTHNVDFPREQTLPRDIRLHARRKSCHKRHARTPS